MSGLDLSTKAGVLRFCELRRAEMVGCFERLGRFESNGFSFEGYLFAAHELVVPGDRADLSGWKTGPRLSSVTARVCRMPEELHGLIPAEHETILFSRTLREMGKLTRAIGSVVMTEMWHATVDANERTLDEARSELPDRLENYDGRKEALFMQLEHTAVGRQIWTAEIRRNPTRLGPWLESQPDDATGRMVDLVGWRS